jgi:hypothetical protein
MMIKWAAGLVIAVIISSSLPTLAASAPPERPAAEGGGTYILAAAEGLPLTEVLHFETTRLVMLAAGAVLGATVVGPYLGISEIYGVLVGLVGGEVAYRSEAFAFGQRRTLF